jgi:hypothetical protein
MTTRKVGILMTAIEGGAHLQIRCVFHVLGLLLDI